MKQRLLAFITALIILFLASNCAGTKPFFQTGNTQGLTLTHSIHTIQLNRHSHNYSYAPTSAEEIETINQGKGKYQFSASLPASFKFEF